MPQVSSSSKVSPGAVWHLSAQFDSDGHRAVLPVGRRCIIGRQPGLDMTLSSPYISGKHAELSSLHGKLVIHDLGSRNGTYVNGERVRRPVYLGSGDVIRVGDVKLRVHHRTPLANKESGPMEQLNFTWLKEQIAELQQSGKVNHALQPIADSHTGEVIGYEAIARSSVTGLETADKMLSAARIFGKEVELAEHLRKSIVESSWPVARGRMIMVTVRDSENLSVEVTPSLERLIAATPQSSLCVAMSHLETRGEPSLNAFLRSVQKSQVNWMFDRFRQDQLPFLQQVAVPPQFVRLHPTLTAHLEQQTPMQHDALKQFVIAIQSQQIQVIATGIDTETAGEISRTIGIDLLQGAFIGDDSPLPSLPLPGTIDFKLDESHVLQEEYPPPPSGSSLLRRGLSTVGSAPRNVRTSTLRIEDIRRALGE